MFSVALFRRGYVVNTGYFDVLLHILIFFDVFLFFSQFSQSTCNTVLLPVEQLLPHELPAEIARRAASMVKPAGEIGEGAAPAGGGGAGRGRGGRGQLECGNDLLTVGKIIQRLPGVARHVTASPAHQDAGRILSLSKLLHLALWPAV